jgi:ribosomal protein S18 acetylase RimI-like enzyme
VIAMKTAAEFRTETRPDDVAAVRDLAAATGYFSASEVAIAAELVEERLQRGPASGYEFLFADGAGRLDGRLEGYACYGLIPCTLSSYDLYWIAVHPDTQGAGLGRRLLQECERRIRALGGTGVYAETSGKAQYVSTRKFYERCDYATGAVFADFYGPGDDKYVFVKILG